MPTIKQKHGNDWTMFHGDCCQVIADIPGDSIDLIVYSPPFANLYIYSDSESDLGNCSSNEEFMQHYSYLISELLRVTVPGRLSVVHCKDLPKYANRDDTAGLIDFPGMIIAAHESAGWSYHSRVTIWKCPVVERERTNNNGLLHKTILRDRSQVRQGMADYLLIFRKPPVGTLMSDKPVTAINKDSKGNPRPGGLSAYGGQPEFDPRQVTPHPSPYARTSLAKSGDSKVAESINLWRRLAEPVWWDVTKVTSIQERAIAILKSSGMDDREVLSALGLDETDAVWFDIDQMDVLNNYKQARGEKDVRHLCPLQIGLIRRAIQLWSMPGDVVLSPFAGVGSEGHGALLENRKFVGIELKDEYFNQACRNLKIAERESMAGSLFSGDDDDDCDSESGENAMVAINGESSEAT